MTLLIGKLSIWEATTASSCATPTLACRCCHDHDVALRGAPIRSVITPPVTGDAAHRRYIYDAWLHPLTDEWDGTTTSEQGVREVAGRDSDDLLAFALSTDREEPDFYEATVRLLYALGNTEGAEMESQTTPCS